MEFSRTPTRSISTGFLPGFLLGGEYEPSGFNSNELRTPTGGYPSGSTSPKDVEMTLAGPSSPQPTTPTSSHFGRASKPSVSGPPPTVSLYDELHNSLLESKENVPSPANKTDVFQQSFQNEISEGHWIMVYGFPPSASAQVLSLFGQIGTIVESSFPASGNWLFVKYAARADARKALTYDARVINGNIMIAVREGKHINQMRVAYPSTPNLNSSLANRSTKSPSVLQSPKVRNLVGPKTQQIPNQSPGPAVSGSPSVVGKAMEILFGGW
ncbi:MPPN [Nesidiocoris tenuis]|uniref:Nucleoporin NUP35 n=1 Tax=Nesidiocoris tenuis TaxID=355587 RepID=A0ABN7ABM5_9HEMI|nr:MPPN [Nesidiocoris tenuis]